MPRQLHVRAWTALLGAGVALAILRLATPMGGPWYAIEPIVAAATMVATLVGARAMSRRRRAPWLLFALAQASIALGSLPAIANGSLAPPEFIGPFLAFAYVTGGLGFVLLWRGFGGADVDAWLDSAVLGLVVGLAAWDFLFEPTVENVGLQLPLLGLLVVDVALLSGMARLLIRRSVPSSVVILTGLVALMIGADLTHYLGGTDGPLLDRVIATAWVLGYAAWGALALHPRVGAIGTPNPPPDERITTSAASLLGVGLALGIPPLVMARAILEGAHPGAPVTIALVAVTAGLVFVRLVRLVRNLEDDVRLRRAAERTAVQSSAQLAAVQSVVPVGIFGGGADGRIAYLNEQLARMAGLGGSADDPDAWLAAIHPDDRARVAAAWEAGIESGAEWSVETRFELPSGTIRWATIRARPAPGGASAPLGWVGSVMDITELVEARLAAEEREAYRAALIEQSPVGILVYAGDGRVVTLNPAMRRLMGPAADGPGATFNILRDPQAIADGHTELARPAFEGRTVSGGRLTVRRPSGAGSGPADAVHLRATFYPLTSATGSVSRVIGFYEDATAEVHAAEVQQRLERDRREAQKLEALGVMAGGIAQDFNNLLAAIIGNLELAVEEAGPGRGLAEDLAGAQAAAYRAAALSRQMLAVSGRGAFVVAPVALDVLAREIVDLGAGSLDPAVHVELALEPMPEITADAAQIRQAISSLVANASDALAGRPDTIRIATRVGDLDPADPGLVRGVEARAGRYAIVEVSDTGPGMDRATALRAFDPFFSTRAPGRGLGLAATLGIVRGHGGAIRLVTSPGHGSTVAIYLPLTTGAAETGPGADASPGVAAIAVEPESDTAPTKRRILVVDDEEGIRTLECRVLERAGFLTRGASDGPAALAALAADPHGFDGVLLDVTLPGMDGFAVLDRVHEIRPDLHVVVCTGWSADEITGRLGTRTAVSFLQKPYTPAALEAAFDAVGPVTAGSADGPVRAG